MSTITFHPSDPLTWKQADADVHVATRDGEFAGFVEFDGASHVVQDHQGAEIGAFTTLDDAFRALEEAHKPVRKPRALSLPLVLPRAFRRRPRRARA